MGSNVFPPPVSIRAQLARRYTNLPLSFESNQGQADASVRFLSHAENYSVLFKDHETDLLLPGGHALPGAEIMMGRGQSRSRGVSSGIEVLRMLLVGGDSNSAPAGEVRLPGTVNYFLGNDPTKWHRNVATFEQIRYSNALPGVNLLYYGDQRHLEFDFEVATGVDARTVHFQFKGARRLKLDQDGNLIIVAANGSVMFHKPVIYQTVTRTHRISVNGGFQLLSTDTVGFWVGNYDRAKPLIIDPVLSYSTYAGFPSVSAPTAIAVDSTGEAYLTGTAPVLPVTTPGAFQGTSMTKSGYWDYSAFVAKFNSAGSALIYCTYLGGSGNDTASAIAVDAAGDAYVAGKTTSEDFPTSPDAFQLVNNAPTGTVIPSTNGFVTEINSAGTALIYSTYLGGHTNDQISGVAVDTSGNAYVTGVTRDADFPVTSGAFQSVNNATAVENQTGFASKLSADGTALAYSTYLGGSNEDFPKGITVDAAGAAYIAGVAESMDFPITTGAFQTKDDAQNGAGFVTKMNTTGTGLVYSTYLSGSLSDGTNAIAVGASGDAYITGFASSADFPVTSGAFQTSINGAIEAAFVTKLNASGTALIYSTFLSGGSAATTNGPEDQGTGIAVDASGNAFIAGSTNGFQFPITPGALQTTNLTATISYDYGSFVTELNSTGASLLYSTYLSGSGIYDLLGGNDPFYEVISGIALDGAGNPYVTGVTYSNDFPVTPGAFETIPGSAGNIFLTKFDASLMKQLPVPTVSVTANANPQAAGVPVVFTAQVIPASGGSTPTGTVSFSIDEGVNAASLGGYPAIGHLQPVNLDGSGTATLTTTALGDGGGSNTIAAYYSGDANNAPSSGSATETITPGSGNLPVAISVTPSGNPSSYGSAVTFGISVKDPSGKGVPDGDVYILDNSAFAGEAILDPSGEATIRVNYLVAGANNLVIWFSSFNGNYASSSVPYLENVTPLGVVPAPVLSLAAGSYPSGQSVTITDAASPDARILYTTNGSVPTSLNGFTYSGPLALSQSEIISAVASENGYTNSPVTSATYNIQAPTPIISPAGGTYTSVQQVTITDSANSAPIYYTTDGTQPTTSSSQYKGPVNVSATEMLQAIASGNGYSSSNVAFASYKISLPPADFSLTISPSSLTVNSGGSAAATLTIAPINGFDQPVTFACSGLPATASCSFSPSTVTPAASATTNLTITATSNTARGNSTRISFAPVTSFALMFGLFTFRKRRPRLFLVLIIAGTGLLFCLSACGSGGAAREQNTLPTNSTITITAMSASLSHSQALTLTLN